jgi:hypothetical protein
MVVVKPVGRGSFLVQSQGTKEQPLPQQPAGVLRVQPPSIWRRPRGHPAALGHFSPLYLSSAFPPHSHPSPLIVLLKQGGRWLWEEFPDNFTHITHTFCRFLLVMGKVCML